MTCHVIPCQVILRQLELAHTVNYRSIFYRAWPLSHRVTATSGGPAAGLPIIWGDHFRAAWGPAGYLSTTMRLNARRGSPGAERRTLHHSQCESRPPGNTA
ncbi:hypothetical protein SBA5_760017 [Candidatus Sulfotelmatomonas gaucii]|uniref:Uncharacterized protein n=1 Tax=Candidatus Sulfuritelmatomonas gaucii TaxID=2043161 RepID=A0A2N9M3X0_9BACT|nr:hypothetical protein SBA5_760017 [Candidatus Sulfotelmatomonas gaucii]